MKTLRLNQVDFQEVAETVLGAGRPFCFRAHGHSMAPFILDGDMVYLKRAPGYRVGDVVLSRCEHRVILHRIVSGTGQGFITRGDAADREDQEIGPEDILGRVYRLSGRGYNFHLRPPWAYLVTTRLFRNFLIRYGMFRKIGKVIARFLG